MLLLHVKHQLKSAAAVDFAASDNDTAAAVNDAAAAAVNDAAAGSKTADAQPCFPPLAQRAFTIFIFKA